jgi:hypothetical protein
MRKVYAAIALIAVAVDGPGVQASTLGIDPAASAATVARDMLPGPILSGPILSAPVENGRASKPEEKGLRLAQNIRVDAKEATSGNPAFLPLIWVGLLVIPNPTPKSPNQITLCTAQFITPTILLTAAHCLQDLPDAVDDKPGAPARKWPDVGKAKFYRQYQNDTGFEFNVVCGLVNPGWALPPDFSSMKDDAKNTALNGIMQHDYAMLLVDSPNSSGAMPYVLDWKGKKNTDFAIRVGYPNAILDSAIVQQVPGTMFFSNAIPGPYNFMTNEVVQWGPIIDATQGMSGGAWIINFDTSGKAAGANTLVAVTSFGNASFPGAAFAAYLTAEEFNPLLKTVSNGCK